MPLALVPMHDVELDADDAATEMAPDLLRDVILPSEVLSSSDCLDVYRRMFAARVETLLGREHPATRAVLGDERFAEIVRDFLAAHPASAHVLTKAGERLPEHLAETELVPPEQREWIAELALLERAVARVSTSSAADALDPDELRELPLERWESARLEPVESLELHAFEHRVEELYDAWLRGAELSAPERRPQWLAVLRRGSRVQRVPMTRRAWLLLAGLCAGRPLAAVLFDHFGTTSRDAARRRVSTWMRAWVANGFFRTVHAG